MSLRHHVALLPLCLSLLGTSTTLLAAGAPVKERLKAPTGPTAVLSATSSMGTATVTVDGAGAFQDALVYTNADGLTADLSWRSALFIDGTQIEANDVKQKSTQKAVSSFALGSLQVKLVQQLLPAALAGGYVLDQQYKLSNPGTEPVTLNLLRYNDSDMYDLPTNTFLGDFGYQPQGGSYNYIVSDVAPTPASLTQYIGVKFSGGDVATRRAVRVCCSNYTDISPEENNTVPNDADQDGISDTGMDMAIAAQAPVTVPPGGSVTVKMKTVLGRSALSGLADLPAR